MMNQPYQQIPSPQTGTMPPLSTAKMQPVATIAMPSEEQIDFNSPGMQGTIQQALSENLGL